MEFDQKEIDKYLHGELSDPVQEELEEKFFLDDDFFQKIETAEMRLVDRFVRGEMNAEEKARFEKGYLTTSPERRTRTAEAAVFHQELPELRSEEAAATTAVVAAAVPKTEPESSSWSEWFKSLFDFRMPAFQLATAATAVLLTAGLVYVIFQFQGPAGPDITGGNQNIFDPPPVNIRTGNTGQNNGSGGAVRLVPKLLTGNAPIVSTELETISVELEEKTKLISLKLPLPAELTGESFSIVIKDAKEKEVLKRNYSRPPSEDEQGKFISFGVQTKDLPDGRHTVSVSVTDKPDKRAVYQFEIKRGG